MPICVSHIAGKLFSKTENEKFKALIQKESSEVLRPKSQLKDGSQLIQAAQTGLHFCVEHSAPTQALTVPGLVLSGTAPHCGCKHTQMNRRCKAEAQPSKASHHRPRDPTCKIPLTEA